MANQSPGPDVSEVTKGAAPIELTASSSVAAFLGPTQKGPVGVPTLIKPDDFPAVFGDPISGSYMAEEVALYGKNGGQYCYIVRQAHYTTITDPTSFDATTASKTLQDATPTNTMVVKASSPGKWGGTAAQDGLKVTTKRRSRIVTKLASNLASGAGTSMVLVNVASLSVGDLITGTDGTNSITVTITAINRDTNTVFYASASPAPGGITAATSTVSLLTTDVTATDKSGNVLRTWPDVRMASTAARYFVTIINSDFRTPFTVTDSASASVDPRPSDVTGAALTGGADGTAPADADYMGSSTGKTGLYAFDAVSEFGGLAVPGVTGTSAAVSKALVDYAAARKFFQAVLDVPIGTSVSGAITFVGTTLNDYSSYAQVIFPWVKILQSDGTKVTVPSSGVWLGIMARTDATRGVYKAPAGVVDGAVRGIIDVEYNVTKDDYDLLYPAKINTIQVFKKWGTCVMGNVTLDPTGEYGEVGIRRFAAAIKKSLKDETMWVTMEPNTRKTRGELTRRVASFFSGLYTKGWIGGDAKKESDAFFVVCNESNNSLAEIAARKLNARYGVAYVHAAEFINETLEQDTRALDAAVATSA